MNIKKDLVPEDKRKPLPQDPMGLAFGAVYTDHMFTLKYTPDKEWHDPLISPYQPLKLDPAALVFHYGQEIFEGQKAYRADNGDILMFRPDENARRMNDSLHRMCMPQIPAEDTIRYVSELVKTDQRWIPTEKGTSLYIRPTVIATESGLGVRPSKDYLFFVILSPVGPYFKEGFNPISVWVSQDFSRAGSGGTGAAKAGGNYGGSLLAAKLAAQKGYSQVLWLDAKEHRFVEEGGAMNIFFIINNKLVTPPLGGTILPGITRKSLLEMAGDMGIEAEERPLDIHDIAEGIASGDVTESFAAGTAAVISPVGTICLEGKDYVINNNQTGPWALKFFDTLTGIQRGDIEDSRNWTYRIT